MRATEDQSKKMPEKVGLNSAAEGMNAPGNKVGDRGTSRSRAELKTPDAAMSLSAMMGGMILMEKEAEGFIFEDPEDVLPKRSKWSAVGKVYSTRTMNFLTLRVHHEKI